MRILVTGGAGFIGSHVARLLSGVHDVSIVDDLTGGYRRNVGDLPLYNADITFPGQVDDVFADVDPEIVVHAAAYASEGLSHWMRRYNYTQNLIGWANIANAALNNNVRRVVVCSSMSIYGSQQPPFDEDMLPQPEDPYAAAKTALEADVRSLGDLFGIEWNIARPHNVYGPKQNLADPYRNVVAIFLRQALTGKPITVYGDGLQTRAFSFIHDVAPVIADLTVGNQTGVTVNIGGEDPVTILELARLVKEVTWSDSEIVHLPPRHEVVDAYSDHRVLRELYGEWKPKPLLGGLSEMADWARTLEIADPRVYDYETVRDMYEPWKR